MDKMPTFMRSGNREPSPVRTLAVIFAVGALGACTTPNPAYCDEDTPCETIALPHCDLTGEFGPSNTCVVEPLVDAGNSAHAADAAPDGSPGIADASTADASLPPAGDWSDPTLLLNVNTSEEETLPAISPDGLELYFIRDGGFPPGTLGDVWLAKRTSTGTPFAAPSKVAAVSTEQNEQYPYISPDNKELWFVRFGEFYVSTRSSPAADWSAPATTGVRGKSPSLTDDMLTLYYQTACPEGGPCVHRRSRPTLGSAWSEPETVALPSGLKFNHVHISGNGLGILLSAPFSATTAKAMQAWKPTLDEEWTTLEVITTLAYDSTNDAARWNGDETEIYLESDRVDGPGLEDLYISVFEPTR